MSRAYVLLSGGLDSSTALAVAMENHGSAAAVSLHYGQRHDKEIEYAKKIAGFFGATWIERHIGGILGKGGLTDPDLEIPKVDYEEMGYGVSPTYVPFRNGTLLAVAASIAQADDEAEAVYYGAHAEDAENWAYPDCTPEFVNAMGDAIYIGTGNRITLRVPFVDKPKSAIVLEGTRLSVPYDLTWSCYEGGEIHCGTCPTCRARKACFIEAGVDDPTEYAA